MGAKARGLEWDGSGDSVNAGLQTGDRLGERSAKKVREVPALQLGGSRRLIAEASA